MYSMKIPVYSTKLDKVNVVAKHLMGNTYGEWLFIVGSGGNGKTMATYEAIELWKKSFGDDGEIISVPLYAGGTAGNKLMLLKKGSSAVKTIVHLYTWGPEWEFMAKEWNATVVEFERGNEPRGQ